MSADSGSPASPLGLPAAGTATQASNSKPRKSLQSGYSLLARGEPKIWFSGGMLVVCLAMIIGLLGLILVSGVPAFWAKPIDLLALDDGTLEIGQLQSIRPELAEPATLVDGESFTVSDGFAGEEQGTSASSPKWDRNAGSKTRRYYRTGNFRLTGRHYRWLSSQELGPAGIGRPEWALVVERMEWGRLYGLPLTVETRLTPGEEARKELAFLADLREILDLVATDDAERLSAVRSAVELAARDLQDTALREQIATDARAPEAELRVQTTESEEWTPYVDISATAKLATAQRKWSDYAAAFAALQTHLQEVIRQREELEQAKYEISRLDAQLSKLRVDVRRAELETGVQAAVQVDTSHYLLEQQEALAVRQAKIPELKERLLHLLPTGDALSNFASSLMDDFLDNNLSVESASLTEQIAQWMEPAASQPELIREAIADYQQGYREIVRKKQPLERRLIELEEQLELTRVDFAVPTGSIALPDVSDDDLSALLAGTVTPTLRAQLENQNIQLSTSSPVVEKLGEMLSLISLQDQAGDKQLLALTSPGYLASRRSNLGDDFSREESARCASCY